jgi:transcriptional regulator with XRE-family HTH domain
MRGIAMNIIKRRQRIIENLKNKEYRDAFVTEHINTGVPFQIRALRDQREWTQKDLGNHVEMAQETISRIEDPNYGKLTLKTLKRLASAFDVALMVRFVPFSELVEWELHLTPDSLKALEFEKESYFKEKTREEFVELQGRQEQHASPNSTVIYLNSYKQDRVSKAQDILINRIQEQNNDETSIRRSGKISLAL